MPLSDSRAWWRHNSRGSIIICCNSLHHCTLYVLFSPSLVDSRHKLNVWHTTATVQQHVIRDYRSQPALELSETLTHYTLVVLKFLRSTPNLPSWSHSSKKHQRPEDKNLHFLYTRPTLDLMKPLVNRWSPFTHCMCTSKPAAATQTRARVNLAILPKVFLCWMPSLFPGNGSEYPGLHTLRVGNR